MVFRRFLLGMIGFCVVASGGFAYAQVKMKRFKKLTEDNVTAFIEETTAMTSVQNVSKEDAKVRAYLDRHINAKARFKSSIIYNMPGLPQQEKTLSLKKSEYINQVKQGAGSIEHYHSEIEIGDIQISKNKKTASVDTVSTETGIMQIPLPDGTIEDVPIKGSSECFQVLKIGKKGYIEMYSANCKTVMEFQSF